MPLECSQYFGPQLVRRTLGKNPRSFYCSRLFVAMLPDANLCRSLISHICTSLQMTPFFPSLKRQNTDVKMRKTSAAIAQDNRILSAVPLMQFHLKNVTALQSSERSPHMIGGMPGGEENGWREDEVFSYNFNSVVICPLKAQTAFPKQRCSWAILPKRFRQ